MAGGLEAVVWFQGRQRTLTLSADGLELEGKRASIHVPVRELVGTAVGKLRRGRWQQDLTVFVVQRPERGGCLCRLACCCCRPLHHQYRWGLRRLALRARTSKEAAEVCRAVADLTASVTSRPKRLKVFVNPFGGHGTAVKTLNAVRPLLTDIAGIELDVTVTEAGGQCAEWCRTSPDLDAFDGVVVAGGDGFYNEAVSGLMARPGGPGNTRVGLLGCGSTNTVSFSTIGTDDVTTSALHIIVGDEHAMDVARIVPGSGGDPIYATNSMLYGFFGDVLRRSESYRWCGPSRYDYTGFLTFFKGRSYGVKIDYLLSDKQASLDDPPCSAEDTVCEHTSRRGTAATAEVIAPDEQWETLEGQYKCVHAAVLPLLAAKTSRGMSPCSHLADGSMELMLVKRVPRRRFLSFLTRVAGGSKKGRSHLELPFVEFKSIRAARISPTGGKTSTWNVDGEVLAEPHIEVQLIPRAITIFARGLERDGPADIPIPPPAPEPEPEPEPEVPPDTAAAQQADAQAQEALRAVEVELTRNDAHTSTDDLAATGVDDVRIEPDAQATEALEAEKERATQSELAAEELRRENQRLAEEMSSLLEQQGIELERVEAEAVAAQVAVHAEQQEAREQEALALAAAAAAASTDVFCSTEDLLAAAEASTATTDLCVLVDAAVQTEQEEEEGGSPLRPSSPAMLESPLPSPEPEADSGDDAAAATMTRPRADSWSLKNPGLTDPQELIEQFVAERHFRLVDLFKDIARRNTKGVSIHEFKARVRQKGIDMNDVQFAELIKRLDRNCDGLISYKDLVVARRRYIQRMRAHDPAWQSWTPNRAPDDVKHKDTFLLKPSASHCYPPI